MTETELRRRPIASVAISSANSTGQARARKTLDDARATLVRLRLRDLEERARRERGRKIVAEARAWLDYVRSLNLESPRSKRMRQTLAAARATLERLKYLDLDSPCQG
jgi:hypothetical protein